MNQFKKVLVKTRVKKRNKKTEKERIISKRCVKCPSTDWQILFYFGYLADGQMVGLRTCNVFSCSIQFQCVGFSSYFFLLLKSGKPIHWQSTGKYAHNVYALVRCKGCLRYSKCIQCLAAWKTDTTTVERASCISNAFFLSLSMSQVNTCQY